MSFLGAWFWRRGEQSLTAPGGWDAFALREDLCGSWRIVWVHAVLPAHVGMEKEGGECHIRPFALRPA